MGSAGLDQHIVHVDRLFGGHVQLVAELAEVRDANAQHLGEPDVDPAGRPERERFGGHIGRGDGGEHLARQRALQVDLGVGRGHVDDLDPAARVSPPPDRGGHERGGGRCRWRLRGTRRRPVW